MFLELSKVHSVSEVSQPLMCPCLTSSGSCAEQGMGGCRTPEVRVACLGLYPHAPLQDEQAPGSSHLTQDLPWFCVELGSIGLYLFMFSLFWCLVMIKNDFIKHIWECFKELLWFYLHSQCSRSSVMICLVFLVSCPLCIAKKCSFSRKKVAALKASFSSAIIQWILGI